MTGSKKDREVHTFPDGSKIYSEQMAEKDWVITEAVAALFKDGEMAAESIGQALIMGAVVTTKLNAAVGGVPSSLYILVGHEGAAEVFTHHGRGREAGWTKFSRALFASGVIEIARKKGTRFLLNIATESGIIKLVDTPEESGFKELGKEDDADFLVRVTAFDLDGEGVIRWWLKAGPTGDPERPVHLLPITSDPMDPPFDWAGHWGRQSTGRQAGSGEAPSLHDVLPPGYEDLRSSGDLRNQVDFRPSNVDHQMFDAMEVLEGPRKEEHFRKAARQLGIDVDMAVAIIRRWGESLMTSAKTNGLRKRGGMRA